MCHMNKVHFNALYAANNDIQNMLVYICHWSPVLSRKTLCRKAEEKNPNSSDTESICSDRSRKWRSKEMPLFTKFRINKKWGWVFSWSRALLFCFQFPIQKLCVVTQDISNTDIRHPSCEESFQVFWWEVYSQMVKVHVKVQENSSRLTYVDKTRGNKRDPLMRGLNIGISWRFLCLVTLLLHLKFKEFELLSLSLSFLPLAEAASPASQSSVYMSDFVLNFVKPYVLCVFLMQLR